MENISYDMNFSDDKDKNNRYNDESKSLPSENKTLKPIKEEQANETIAEYSEISKDRHENVAEKVEGDTISKTHLDNNAAVEGNSDSSDNYNVIETTDDPETVIRDLEARHLHRLQMKKLPPQARHILLLAASLHRLDGKGITVGYLEKLGFRKDNAEKQLQDSRRNGLLIPGDIRNGRQKQYYLSNYKYILDEVAKRKNKDEYKDILADDDKDITLQLLQLLSNRKYTYHNIHLETNLCYGDDYEILEWNIPSIRNKQKVTSFKLELLRKCSIILSANGTINISIECTLDPFKLHTPSGLIEFIGSCGQALNVLQSAAKNRLNVVPRIAEWYLLSLIITRISLQVIIVLQY